MDGLPALLLGAGGGCPWQALERLQRALAASHDQPPWRQHTGNGVTSGTRYWAARHTPCAKATDRVSGCGSGGGGGGGAGSGGGGWRWVVPTRSVAAWAPLASVTTLGSVTAAAGAATAAAAGATTAAATAGTATAVAAGGGAKHLGGTAAGSQGRLALRDFSGTWIKDRERSDSMDGAMNLMHLNGIVRQAVKLVRGVRIEQRPDTFTFTVFSFVSWFKVREVYPMSGEQRRLRRRDLRRGGALGCVEPAGQDLRVRLEWNDPRGGSGTDHFRLISEDELQIESLLQVDGQSERYVTVYRRK